VTRREANVVYTNAWRAVATVTMTGGATK